MVVQTGASEEKKLISNLRPYSHYSLAVSVFNSKGEGPLSEALLFNTPEGGENEKEKTITDANDDSWRVGGGVGVWNCDRVNNTHLEDNRVEGNKRKVKDAPRQILLRCWQTYVTLQQKCMIVKL